jgi:hypothetical protein
MMIARMRCHLCSMCPCRTEQIAAYEQHRLKAAGPAAAALNNAASAAPQQSSIKLLAQRRLAEAEAAIAAAEQSAMQAMQGERFSGGRIPPWETPQPRASAAAVDRPAQQDVSVAAPSPAPPALSSLGSFRERLKKHEAHLSAMQQGAAPALAAPARQHNLLHAVAPADWHDDAQAVPPPWAYPSFLPAMPRNASGASGVLFTCRTGLLGCILVHDLLVQMLSRHSCAGVFLAVPDITYS